MRSPDKACAQRFDPRLRLIVGAPDARGAGIPLPCTGPPVANAATRIQAAGGLLRRIELVGEDPGGRDPVARSNVLGHRQAVELRGTDRLIDLPGQVAGSFKLADLLIEGDCLAPKPTLLQATGRFVGPLEAVTVQFGGLAQERPATNAEAAKSIRPSNSP